MTQYLSATELSERWSGQIAPKTLANWRSTGRGPAWRRYCGRVLYPLDAVLEFEQASTFSSTRNYERKDRGVPSTETPASCVAQREELEAVRDQKLRSIAEARLKLDAEELNTEQEFQSAIASVKPRRGRPRKIRGVK